MIVRLIVGLVFGVALAWLIKTWPQSDKEPLWAQVVTSVLALGAFVLWAGAGTMRRISYATWGATALALIGLVAWNHCTHDGDNDFNPLFFNLSFLIYPFLFIAHELVNGGDQTRRLTAPYALYFEEATKRVVQLAVALLFAGLLWAILWLGAALLNMIGFHWLETLLQSEWVEWPVMGTALAAGVQLGDVQPKLIQGFRGLVLGVLSWLLPVITAIGALFAVSLCFSGLDPLWKTKAASASLLGACVVLALLVIATYQEGDAERKVHVILRWAARGASILLLAFALLAAVSLHLRIHQYGLTPERVIAAVGVFLAVLFGLGYAYAAVAPKGRWMARLEPVNIGLAFVMVVVFFAVLTPVADPYRLSADSQAARVQSGAISPDMFDWKVLRFETGTWGRARLHDLIKRGRTADIRAAATKAMALTDDDRYQTEDQPEPPQVPVAKAFKLVYPKGASVPADFMSQAFTADEKLPYCATTADDSACAAAAVIDLDHDGTPEILVLQTNELIVMAKRDGRWHAVMDSRYLSGPQQDDFKAGKVTTTPHRLDDIRFGEQPPVNVVENDAVQSPAAK